MNELILGELVSEEPDLHSHGTVLVPDEVGNHAGLEGPDFEMGERKVGPED